VLNPDTGGGGRASSVTYAGYVLYLAFIAK